MNHFFRSRRKVVLAAILIALTTGLRAQSFSIFSELWVSNKPFEPALGLPAEHVRNLSTHSVAVFKDDSGDVLRQNYAASLLYYTQQFAATDPQATQQSRTQACQATSLPQNSRTLQQQSLPLGLLAVKIDQLDNQLVSLHLVQQCPQTVLCLTDKQGQAVFMEVFSGKQYVSKQFDFGHLAQGDYTLTITGWGKSYQQNIRF